MKKIISVILILSVLFCLVSCRSAKNTDSSVIASVNESVLEKTDSSSEDTTTSEIISDTVSDNSTVDSSMPESSVSSKVNSSSKPVTSSVKQPTVSSNTSKPTVKTKPNLGAYYNKIKYTLNDMLKEVPHYTFKLPGSIVDYITYEDLIYVVYNHKLTQVNQIDLFDAKAGKIVKSNPLPSRPAEMHMYGNELWISFPELCQINIYNKTNFEFIKSINTGAQVYSFDKYNNYVFYAQEQEKGFINRYDMNKQIIEPLFTIYGEDKIASGMFYEPAILVDTNTSTLYIGESGLSSCKLFAFDIETMEDKGATDYRHNWARKLQVYNGYIYWSTYKIDTNYWWKKISPFNDEGIGTLYLGAHYCATTAGIFDSNTGKKAVSFPKNFADADEKYKFSITKCNNIMVADDKNLYIFYG